MKTRSLTVLQLKWLFKQPLITATIVIIPIAVFTLALLVVERTTQDNDVSQPFHVAVVDHDNAYETKLLFSQLKNDPSLQKAVTFEKVTEETAYHMLDENKVAAILIIPEQLTYNMRQGKNSPLHVIGNNEMPIEAALIKAMTESITTAISAAQTGINTVYHYASQQPLADRTLQQIYHNALGSYFLLALSRQQIFDTRSVSAFALSPIAYYIQAATFLSLLLTGLLTFVTQQTNRSAVIEKRMLSFGVTPFQNSRRLFFFYSAVLFIALMIIQLILLSYPTLQATSFDSFAWGPLACTILALSSLFTLFQMIPLRGLTIMAGLSFAAAHLIVGGLILPFIYLPEAIQPLRYFTLSYWMLSGHMNTQPWVSVAVLLFLTAISFRLSIAIQRKGGWHTK